MPLEEVYLFLLEKLERQLRRTKARFMADVADGLPSEQWVILKRVSEQDGISQTEAAETTLKDPAAVTRLVDALEASDYLERRPVEGDRRRYGLHLKPKGQALVERVLPHAVTIRAEGLKGLSDSEVATFKKALRFAHDNFQRLEQEGFSH